MATGQQAAGWPPERRWLAGLLWADGHLDTRARHGGTAQLNLVDEQTLAAAATLVDRPYSTTRGKERPGGGRYSPLHRLTFTDYELIPALVSMGFGPKPLRPWPADLASGAFLRGLFDGDGSVGWHHSHGRTRQYLQVRLGSPLAVLEGTRDWLADLGFRRNKVIANGHYWQLSWNHYDSLHLAEVMYGEPGPFMARKHATFAEVRP